MNCIARIPTPVLNTPDFHQVFTKLPLDDQGLLRALEMIALPGTKFQILEKHPNDILEVKTEEYLCGPLYIDSRFTKPFAVERKKVLPPAEVIRNRLINSLGLPYIWGGNWGKGIPEISSIYGAPKDLFSGVDCSGLLYEATGGFTPRNTSDLMQFGEEVDDVKPLDILIWPGHVIIFLEKDLVIESLLGKGVITTLFEERRKEIPQNQYIIRRFIPPKTRNQH
ncbi:MAG: hypothetical protein P0S96_08625 [Simkaniaceae bacterium]|nr:hypothetical protein [Candidatus Sacchlamyda saccharinae]